MLQCRSMYTQSVKRPIHDAVCCTPDCTTARLKELVLNDGGKIVLQRSSTLCYDLEQHAVHQVASCMRRLRGTIHTAM